jgi:hypothetical protein
MAPGQIFSENNWGVIAGNNNWLRGGYSVDRWIRVKDRYKQYKAKK